MDFVPAVAMSGLVLTVVNFCRYVRGQDWSAVLTQAIAWLGGVVVVAIFAQSDFADGLTVGGMAMSSLSGWSIVAVGMTVGAAPSVLVEGFKAIDNTRTTAKPALFRRAVKPPTEEGNGTSV